MYCLQAYYLRILENTWEYLTYIRFMCIYCNIFVNYLRILKNTQEYLRILDIYLSSCIYIFVNYSRILENTREYLRILDIYSFYTHILQYICQLLENTWEYLRILQITWHIFDFMHIILYLSITWEYLRILNIYLISYVLYMKHEFMLDYTW